MDWDFLEFNLAITEEVLTEDCPSALLAKVKAAIQYSFPYVVLYPLVCHMHWVSNTTWKL